MAEKRMVFAIGRRCGSGGREVGKKLADHYGIKFYDKEIVTMLAERMNMPEDEVAKLEEKVTGHFSTKSGFAAAKDTLMGKMTKSDRMYLTEYALIADLAATENCVIVGRSGNAILADNTPLCTINLFTEPNLFFCFVSNAIRIKLFLLTSACAILFITRFTSTLTLILGSAAVRNMVTRQHTSDTCTLAS